MLIAWRSGKHENIAKERILLVILYQTIKKFLLI